MVESVRTGGSGRRAVAKSAPQRAMSSTSCAQSQEKGRCEDGTTARMTASTVGAAEATNSAIRVGAAEPRSGSDVVRRRMAAEYATRQAKIMESRGSEVCASDTSGTGLGGELGAGQRRCDAGWSGGMMKSWRG